MVSSESYTILATISISSAKKLRTIRKLCMHPTSGEGRKVEADQLSEMLCTVSLAGWIKWHIKLPLNY